VLPFEVPRDLPRQLPSTAVDLVRSLFPKALVFNDVAVHELCRDRLATTRRLLARGVPMPDGVITDDEEEATAFIVQHEYAVLKEPRSCGGQGHVVVHIDHDEIVGESHGRRYLLELDPSAAARKLDHGVMRVPPPFYLQRLVVDVGRQGRLGPAQVVRAYIVDGQVVCWTERYREHYERLSDFVVSVVLGGRYRFLQTVSEEIHKMALRAAEVLDVRFGAVDLVRTGREGPFVLHADTDGPQLLIDREFKLAPEFRRSHDFDQYLAEALVAPVPEPEVRRVRVRGDAPGVRRGGRQAGRRRF
jgi:glutathione synthase/RimK-type ligase-like ATP-grasp enzyme